MEQNHSQGHERDPNVHDPADRGNQKARTFDLKTVLICAIIFATAVSVSLMHRQDLLGASPVPGMEAGDNARQLLAGKFALFFNGPNPPNDAMVLIRPPGYAMLVAALFKIFGASDDVMRMFQMLCNAAAAVLVFLLASKLLAAKGVATVAGLLVALAPQLASYSFAVVPDSLIMLPILGIVFALIKFTERQSLITVAAIGALIGLSLWLRANTLLLAPFLAVWITFLARGRLAARLRYAAVLIGITVLVISPITLHNWIVFHHFIPVQLGGGIALVEGIARYDTEKRFGESASDMGVCRVEAALYHRPDYVDRLFQPDGPSIYVPDGIAREDARLKRGLAIIRSHPLWFAGVMIRRATNILRLERSIPVATEPSVTHPFSIADSVPPTWSGSPSELASTIAIQSPRTRVSLSTGGETFRIESDGFRRDDQLALPPIRVEASTDYLLRIPVKLERDGMNIRIVSVTQGVVLASKNIYQWADTPPDEQPVSVVQVPFVSRNTNEVRIVFGDFAEKTTRPVVEVGRPEVFPLGPASHLWTRFPRLLVHLAQKFFLTATVLPLVIAGFLLLVRARQKRALTIILAIPVYYMCFQSVVHFEYRYILPVYYFTFILAAVALTWIGETLWRGTRWLTRSLTVAR